MVSRMTERDSRPDDPRPEELSEEELEAERGAPLPDREALSVLNADVAIPADPAIAADVLSGEGTGGDDPVEEQPPDEQPPAEERPEEEPPDGGRPEEAAP
jgi:hypothetical protein